MLIDQVGDVVAGHCVVGRVGAEPAGHIDDDGAAVRVLDDSLEQAAVSVQVPLDVRNEFHTSAGKPARISERFHQIERYDAACFAALCGDDVVRREGTGVRLSLGLGRLGRSGLGDPRTLVLESLVAQAVGIGRRALPGDLLIELEAAPSGRDRLALVVDEDARLVDYLGPVLDEASSLCFLQIGVEIYHRYLRRGGRLDLEAEHVFQRVKDLGESRIRLPRLLVCGEHRLEAFVLLSVDHERDPVGEVLEHIGGQCVHIVLVRIIF